MDPEYNQRLRNNLKWIAAAGNIERYPKQAISDRLKSILLAMIYGVAIGFVFGFILGMNV
jgi:hypothetical protein